MSVALPGVVQAQFLYTTNNGAITITRYNGSDTTLVIPDTLSGRPVTRIADTAFYSQNLLSLTVPSSITNIGNAAFSYCSSLTNIAVDPSNPVYSGSNGVLFDKALTTIVGYPPGVGGTYAIPADVTSVGDYAFYGSSLSGVTLPTGVVNIGDHAFNSCYILATVNIPSSVTNIGTNAFAACTSLVSISVDPSNPAYSGFNGVLYDKGQLNLVQAPAGLDGSYVIPPTVTRIGQYSFYQCFNLTNVTIPDAVTSIGDYAFFQCTGLTSATIPNAVNSIGQYGFGSCSRLSHLTLSDSLTNIGSYAFNSCYALANVVIPARLASLGSQAFSSCSSLVAADFQGNAPPDTGGAFSGDPLATVYYLAGTTGWGTKYGGVKAVLLNPQAQAGNVAVANGQFGFLLTGPTNGLVVIEACTNLSNATWLPLTTNTLTGGLSSFSDPQWKNYVQRFYRLSAR